MATPPPQSYSRLIKTPFYSPDFHKATHYRLRFHLYKKGFPKNPKASKPTINTSHFKCIELEPPQASDNSKLPGEKSKKIDKDCAIVNSTRRDHAIKFTHCNEQTQRVVCKDAFQRGVVLTRCSNCNHLLAVADRLGFFGPLIGSEQHRMIELFLKAIGTPLPEGSFRTFCATFETKETLESLRYGNGGSSGVKASDSLLRFYGHPDTSHK